MITYNFLLFSKKIFKIFTNIYLFSLNLSKIYFISCYIFLTCLSLYKAQKSIVFGILSQLLISKQGFLYFIRETVQHMNSQD